MQVTEGEFLNERFLNAKLVQGEGLQALRGNKENKDVWMNLMYLGFKVLRICSFYSSNVLSKIRWQIFFPFHVLPLKHGESHVNFDLLIFNYPC